VILLRDDLAKIIETLREQQPVVHAMTNAVTVNDVANVLRAVGARPIMAGAKEEVEEIVSRADALALNLGTPTPDRVEAMILAGRQANALRKPVVFDPVGVSASRFRIDSARRILSELHITVIKGNRAEMGSLSGMGGELRGLDAVHGPTDLLPAAETLSHQTGAVVVVSGERDLVVGKGRRVVVENGHPLMARVTGTGCMLTAVIAAFAAVEPDPMMATAAAAACFGLAGENAARQAKGPGTFKMLLLDSLYALSPEELRSGMKITC
jgi:hydroxyethylthiazole kinase